MDDVGRLILESWEKLGPKIMADPHELNKRLARRRTPTLTRPPRAWCLAIRASDRRITSAHWIITPEHALDLDHPEHPYEPIEHEVTIQPHALRKFCRPVHTDSLGEEMPDVAKQLGVGPAGLIQARYANVFKEKFVKGLGGKHGRPVPLIHSWNALDPAGTEFFCKPDAVWGALWEFLPDMIPDNFEQTVVRRPKFKRLNPHGREEAQLTGYRWVCPACKKEVRKIYYPLPPRTLFDYLGYDPGTLRRNAACASPEGFTPFDADRLEAPPPTFACFRCHDVRVFTRSNYRGWNEVVSQLTRGMLLGMRWRSRRGIARRGGGRGRGS